jgi:hypothetical protein
MPSEFAAAARRQALSAGELLILASRLSRCHRQVDQPGLGEFVRLQVFLRQFLPLLRSCPNEMVDLFIVTPYQRRRFAYQKLLQRSRAILKLGVGPFLSRIKPFSVRPPVPTIIETIWPSADNHGDSADLIEDSDDHSEGHSDHKSFFRPIGE